MPNHAYPLACVLLLLLGYSCTSTRETGVDPTDEPAATSQAAPTDLEPTPSWRKTSSHGNQYEIEWHPRPDPIPLNEAFEMIVRIRDSAGVLQRGAQVVVRGFMPGHGHGMLRDPRSEEVGDGAYVVRGMLLHMTGLWEMTLDVIIAGAASSATFELTLD